MTKFVENYQKLSDPVNFLNQTFLNALLDTFSKKVLTLDGDFFLCLGGLQHKYIDCNPELHIMKTLQIDWALCVYVSMMMKIKVLGGGQSQKNLVRV